MQAILLSREEVARLARQLYEGSIRQQVETEDNIGMMVIIDIETGEKGFAEAKLKKAGQDLAMLAISDTISTPNAGAKFQNSTKQIAGYPAMEIGKTQTAVLVGDRYQVKVISRDPSFTSSDRAAWIQKFNLRGLSRLQ